MDKAMSQIGAIQILRALAALMVVFSHAQGDTLFQAIKADGSFTQITAVPWVAGVDLFFVTSGFIMVHASQRLFAMPDAPMIFLGRRLIRIVPLYWLVTAISLSIAFGAASLGKHASPHLPEIASSFGFVPFARPEDGQMRPIAAQGWTLNYEMFFYAIFAVFVRFQRGAAIAGVALGLTLIVGLGAIFHPRSAVLAYWSDPIVLEFVLGMGLAVIWRQGYRLRRWMIAPLAGIAIAALGLDLDGIAAVPLGLSEPNGLWRLAGCGLPMALLFGAVVLAEPAVTARSRTMAFLAHAGDASYALYLFHPLVIILTRKAFLAAHLESLAGFWPLVAADLAVSVVVALAIYRFIEKPVTLKLQNGFNAKIGKTRQNAGIAGVQAG
jgi:exopolysaccharide production protein ExoZ